MAVDIETKIKALHERFSVTDELMRDELKEYAKLLYVDTAIKELEGKIPQFTPTEPPKLDHLADKESVAKISDKVDSIKVPSLDGLVTDEELAKLKRDLMRKIAAIDVSAENGTTIVSQRVKQYKTRVIVQKPEDFSPIVDGKVTPDSTKLYMIDGIVDMGSVSIVVPEGGLSVAGLNGGRDIMMLVSSADNYTLFVSPVGGYSGGMVIESCTLDVTGVNSQVFDLDNDGNNDAIDITGVNFGLSPVERTTSMGEMSNYRQLLLDGVGFIFISDGLTFNGTWTGLAVTTSIAVGFPAATLFKEGAGFAIDNVRSDINFLSVQPTSVLFDFDAANINTDGGMSLTNVRTTADNAVPNVPSSSVKARFKDCSGIKNTYVGGDWTLSTATATNITSANTLVKMAGTTTYKDMQWFSNTTNNAFVYDSSEEIDVEVKGTLSFSGGNNDVLGVQVRQWDDSASAYVNVNSKFTATLNGGGGTRVENLTFIARTTLNENDRIEVWIENQTNTTNITCEVGGFVGITERAS